jgi:hypothetical protein
MLLLCPWALLPAPAAALPLLPLLLLVLLPLVQPCACAHPWLLVPRLLLLAARAQVLLLVLVLPAVPALLLAAQVLLRVLLRVLPVTRPCMPAGCRAAGTHSTHNTSDTAVTQHRQTSVRTLHPTQECISGITTHGAHNDQQITYPPAAAADTMTYILNQLCAAMAWTN